MILLICLVMNSHSSSNPYLSNQTHASDAYIVSERSVWLINYSDGQSRDLQILRDLPTPNQLENRYKAIAKNSEQKLQRSLSLTEIDTDIDMRWSNRFMPREFA